MNKERLYQCPVCGLHYKDETTAKKCEAWCSQHASCNLEITKLAVETQRQSDRPQMMPGSNSPMDKFNKALRKILSVPKKDINKK